jgi:tetratricopeptide (TPR) repeat protein
VNPLTIVGIVASVITIVAGTVQVVQYLQERRRKRAQPEEHADIPTTAPNAPIPHNLPPRGEFIGRAEEKARVHEALVSRYPLTGIDGIGGIGKTALALEVAHECLHASRGEIPADGIATFAGFIWATAKDRDLTLNALLDAVARTLEYPGIAQQPVEEKRPAVRKLLDGAPYLLIVDNYETITDEGVRDFLLGLPEPSKALITTREQRLRQVWAISLRGLAEPEALALIRSEGRRLGLASLERAPDRPLQHLYRATGGAPLAIKWAVAQIKQKGQSLDTVLAALHEARGSIFEDVFTRSWHLLSSDARQALLVMPLFVTSVSRAAVEAVSNVRHFALDEALGQLVEMSLLDVSDDLDLARRRYSIHPLTRAFAAAKIQQAPGELFAAQQRLAGFFGGFTKQHGGLFNREGYARLEPDLPNILASIQWCHEHGFVDLGLDTFEQVSHFLIIRGYWSDTMALGEQAVRSASESGRELRAAKFRLWPVAWLHRRWGSLDLAESEIAQAMSVFERDNVGPEIAFAKSYLGRVAQGRGQLDQAERLLREALDYYESAGDERHTYYVAAKLADVLLERGDLDAARALCEKTLGPAQRHEDPERIADLLRVLGGVAYRRGELQEAKAFWEDALSQLGQVNRLDRIADCLFELACLEMKMGGEREARGMLAAALDTYKRLGIQSKIEEAERLLAELPEMVDPEPPEE